MHGSVGSSRRCSPSGSPKGSIPVVDRNFEIRIGGSNQIVGLTADWRPIAQSAICSPIAPPDIRDLNWSPEFQERSGTTSTDYPDDSAGDPILIYARAAGDSGSENWLVPYFVFPGDPVQHRYLAALQPSQYSSILPLEIGRV